MPAIKIHEAQGEDTQNTVAVASRERDETQKHIDQRFKSRFEHWTTAGKPKPDKAPREATDRITVAKTDVAALKGMIRRAATLHKTGVVFYKDAKDGNGNTTVKYVPAPPTPKAH
jgi:hypothetical protein